LFNLEDENTMGSGTLLVHIGDTNRPVFVTDLENSVNLIFITNIALCHVLHINTSLFGLMDFQIVLLWVKEIPNLLIVNF